MRLRQLAIAISLVAVTATAGEARPAATVFMSHWMNSTDYEQNIYLFGVTDGGAVFLHDVYGATFWCAGGYPTPEYVTLGAKVTEIIWRTPANTWHLNPAGPVVFQAMFELGCTIGPLPR